MGNIASVISIIIAAGLTGGWAACLVDRSGRGLAEVGSDGSNSLRVPVLQFLLLGIIAAACVPLFLSLVKSGLMSNIFEPPAVPAGQATTVPFEDYLIFAGLCLIASFSARSFIDSVSKQVLRKVEQVQETADAAVRTAADARSLASEAATEVEQIDANAELPNAVEKAALEQRTANPEDLNVNDIERRVLEAMASKTYRTRTGIAEDSGVSRHRISDLLETLYERKLALPTKSPSTGGARWTISSAGREALSR